MKNDAALPWSVHISSLWALEVVPLTSWVNLHSQPCEHVHVCLIHVQSIQLYNQGVGASQRQTEKHHSKGSSHTHFHLWKAISAASKGCSGSAPPSGRHIHICCGQDEWFQPQPKPIAHPWDGVYSCIHQSEVSEDFQELTDVQIHVWEDVLQDGFHLKPDNPHLEHIQKSTYAKLFTNKMPTDCQIKSSFNELQFHSHCSLEN